MNRHLASVPLAATLFVAGTAAAQFTDVTTAPLNATFSGIGGGWVDYDSDGDLDLFRTDFSSSSLNRLYRNDDGSFSDRSDADIRWGAVSSKAGAGWADWDGDGDLDVVVSSSGSARLFRLDTPDNYNSVLDLGVSGGRAVCWSDLDVDGDLDLFLAGTGGSAVWSNDGDGTFTQLTFNVRAQGAQLGDYDRDGDPDLLICYDGDGTRLYRNDGPDQWAEIQPELINTNPAAALGSRFVDLDNDGDLDIATASYNNALPNSIFRNDGTAGFTDVTDESGDFASVTSETEAFAFADWDLDGDLDVYLANNSGNAATTGALLRNDGDLHFTDITTQLPPRTGTLQYFAAPGDYDLDGDPDLFIAGWGDPGQLLRNDQQSGNHWLHVTLRGAVETSGIGSWIEVTSGALTQSRYVGGGESWATQSPSPFHLFGLGTATTANVTVHWPSGATTTRTNVPVDRRIEIYEPGAETVTTDPFSPGATFEFTLDPGVATVQDAVLFLRRAGTTDSFTSIPMTFVSGSSTWQAAVASGFATVNGVEYFVDYRRGFSALRFPYAASPEAPAFVPASLSGENARIADIPGANQYAMIGIPFAPTNGDPSAVLGDELGGYDKTKWRLARFNPLWGNNGAYAEFPGTGAMAPGQGFWLIMKDPVAFGTSGTSTPTPGGFPLRIERGWNQIAHPYLFDVAKSDIDFSGAPNVEQALQDWNGSGYVEEQSLEPWKGYFVFNAAAAAERIVIPGTASGSSRPAGRSAPAVGEWSVTVSARQGDAVDHGVVAGVAREATNGVDALDRHAPPAPPSFLRASFERDWQGDLHELRRDLRAPGDARFDLVVEAPGDEPVQLDLDGIADVPADRSVVLIPEDTWSVIDLRERSSFTLSGHATHRFRLVVGSDSFVEQVREGRTESLQVELGLGYPNPFTASTRLSFTLPAATNVEMSVYDVSGRRLRRLVGGTQPAGRHVATWDGRDEAGRAAAPGVYFVRLTASGREETRKLVLRR